MRFVGVDLASQPKKSSLAVLDWHLERGDRPRVVDLRRPATDDLIVDIAATADAIGLDCPLGWPAPFVETIRRHHDGEPALVVQASPRDLRLRTTDQWIRRHIPRDPLSVSTDRLGIVALRGIGILERIAGPGADRSGGGAGIYEAYPGGSLAVWGLTATGYKDPSATKVRAAIVAALAQHIELADTAAQLEADADDLDAVITAVVTGLAHHGLTTAAPPEHHEIARVEGWIHVPTVGLDALAHVVGTNS